jgi:ABC-type bacteriocin/lantibiotic exporter with double-glycine peptidase domain
MAGLFFTCCLFSSWVAPATRCPELLKQVRAWMKGARYITDKGVVLQSRPNDCGPASLKMILAFHGIDCSISELSQDLHLTPRGTSILSLRIVSAKLGIPAKTWKVRPEDLGRVPLPAIAFVNRNHFVVIRRFIAPEILEVDDPALGRIQWPTRAFHRIWSGETLVFDPAWRPL